MSLEWRKNACLKLAAAAGREVRYENPPKMASAEELKCQRELQIKKIDTAVKKLKEQVIKKNDRLIRKYHNDVHNCYKDFENVHLKYLHKEKKSFDDPVEVQVFEDVSEKIDDADMVFEEFKSVKEQEQEETARTELMRKEEAARAELMRKEVENLKRKQASRARNFLSEIDIVVSDLEKIKDRVQSDDLTPVNIKLVKVEIDHLQSRFKDALSVLQEYDEACSDPQEDTLKELMNQKKVKDSQFRADLLTVKGFILENDTGGASGLGGDGLSAHSGEAGEKNAIFQYKKMDFPKFNGIIRHYQTFKKDFHEMIVDKNLHDDKQLGHILRNECLTGTAKSLVQNIHDYKTIWTKLDGKFEDKGEVIEQITNEITNLKKVGEGEYDSFVKLVDTVEKAQLDLGAIGNFSCMNNPLTVRLILSKCPRSIQEGLTRELSEIESEKEFETLLKYLLPRRKDATRLARLESDKAPTQQTKKKASGAAHAVDGKKKGASGGTGSGGPSGGSSGWKCWISTCKYKQKHYLAECRAFKRLTTDEKGQLVLDKKLCTLCFGNNHDNNNCPKKTSGWRECDVNNCGRWHSRMLHGATTPGLSLCVSTDLIGKKNSKTLLLMQEIPLNSGEKCLTLWDHGSTTSLISFEFAEKHNLVGTDCILELAGVGEKVNTLTTKLYFIPLVNIQGVVCGVHAFGIEKITSDALPVSLGNVAQDFGLADEEIARPTGSVDLLLGMDQANLMPKKDSVIDNLALYSSCFGTGWIVGGVLKEEGSSEDDNDSPQQVFHLEVRGMKPVDFFSAEGFGVDIARRCKSCNGCKECAFKARQMTWREAQELAVIEKGLTLDPVAKVWTAKYPYATDPSVLKNNYGQALACMISTEKRLKKNKQLEQYNKQFEDAVERGVFEEVKEEDVNSYEGPVNYITITEAFKSGEHATTPIRLCMNSSMKYQGKSLNDILLKGPASLNDIYSVLLNFRGYKVGFVKDISKFYQSVKVIEQDKHVRRVLWRNGDVDVSPKIYKTNTVNFGDKPAGCIALTAVNETADLFRNINPVAADRLKNDKYCDDVASGGKNRVEAELMSKDMDEIVDKGGFKFKSTVMSGDDRDPGMELRKVLGTSWDSKEDCLLLDIKVNVSEKKKGVRTEPDIQLDVLDDVFPTVVTKRLVWRIVLSQFDLLGLASVFLIRLKLIMRKLSGVEGQKIGWDETIPDQTKSCFLQVLKLLPELKKVKFQRSIVPDNVDWAVQPDLLVFGDGSEQAFCALAYARWKLLSGEHSCILISGKTRVAPLTKISIPRMELMGAVAAVRLAANIEEALKPNIVFKQRFFFTDNTSVLAMIRGDSAAFKEFVGTRVGEIKNKSEPEQEWSWVPTDQNLADMGTREDTVPKDLAPGGEYQTGKQWMKLEEKLWPVKKSIGTVPEDEVKLAARLVNTLNTDPELKLAV